MKIHELPTEINKYNIYSKFQELYFHVSLTMTDNIYQRVVTAMPPHHRGARNCYIGDYVSRKDVTPENIKQLFKDADV